MKRTTGGLLFTLMTAVSTSALAHYMFIMPESFHVAQGEPLVLGIHNSDSFPDSDSAARIAHIDLHGADAATVDLTRNSRRMVGEFVPTAAGHVIAAASTEVMIYEMDAAEFLKYLQDESLTHVIEWREANGQADKPARERYAKYAKSILLVGDAKTDGQFGTAVGLPIEFIPEASPYLAAVGDSLPVRVLFQGQPAPDLEITASWIGANGAEMKKLGRTDAEGRLSVPLVASGAWRLHTILMEKRDEADVDWESYWAILTFEVPAAE